MAHRVAYELANGPIDGGLFVMHKCDNRRCVNPEHLTLGTFADNMADMVRKSRQAAGSRNSHAKLRELDVIEIRSLIGKYGMIAKRYNVSQTTISEIKARKIWRHV